MSERFASLEDSVAFIKSLGFVRVVEDELYFDSKGKDAFGSIVQILLYRSRNGYWCCSIDGGYSAPVVWNDPENTAEKDYTEKSFIDWLDKYHPGWR